MFHFATCRRIILRCLFVRLWRVCLAFIEAGFLVRFFFLTIPLRHAKKRLRRYFQHVEALFSPDLFIIGGGISKNPEKFMPYFEDEIRTPMVMATLRNNAGIVGAALWAGGMPSERQRRGEL